MSAVDRTRPPAAGAIRDFDFPVTDRLRLENGLDLRVARVARLPLVSLDLFMRGGEQGLGRD
ncbi:MAG TPA: hypothetical protein VLA43_14505, partial [Longimicrobiales bacterium]|nr:hypothetical protein [Longimicrobiales bacterium]